MKRALVAHNVPKHLIEKLPVSQAGNYFTYNLINGNFFQYVFSLIPTNIVIDGVIEKEKAITYIHIRKFGNKLFVKPFNILVENLKLIQLVKENEINHLWFYNLTVHTLIAFIYLKYFSKKINLYIILLDFTPSISKFSLQNLILLLINKSDGVISLTDNNIITNKKKAVIPGIVPEKLGEELLDINSNFLLSGILSDNRNPKLILDLFSKLPELTLYITGIFNDKDLLNDYLVKCPNIKFLGLLDYDEYMNILNKCTFCINSRDPNYPENHYNFPSKVIEYLQHNRIVISTMQYEELKEVNYIFLNTNDFEMTLNFKNQLKDIDKLKKYANQSVKVNELFGYNKWQKTLNEIENAN